MLHVKIKRWSFSTVGIFCLMAVSGLHPALAAETIRINGSGSCLDMMKPLIKAYVKANPTVTIEMKKPLGSSGAIKALLSGALDIAVSSKQLKPEETAQGARSREYGKMPLAIIVSKDVSKTDITTRELEDIFALKLDKWPDGTPIRLVLRPEGDMDTKILRELSPAMDKAVSVAQKHQGMIVAVTDPEVIEVLSRTSGGFGLSGLSSLIVEKPKLNQLSLNGVKPTTKALAAGSYPLAKHARFIVTDKTSPAASKFLEFVYSPKGRAIAEKAGLLVTAEQPTGK